MQSKKLKIAVLTSSRADYSIYYPLLRKLKEDHFFKLNIIAFGSHLSKSNGYTINSILSDGFKVKHKVAVASGGDAPEEITRYMAATMQKFALIWKKEKYDLVFALGDRYEMFAAVSSGIPFNTRYAHIHGGETTLGAIDDAFRHSITTMSTFHFATTEVYKNRVIQIKGSKKNVFNVGALSIDNLTKLKLYSISEFERKFRIDLSKPSILITFHPETVSFEKNKRFIKELITALRQLKRYQLIITMPNTDTMGMMVREKLEKFIDANANVIGVENFGTLGYLSCMKHCAFMLGNTSSGFVEASYFPKHVINLGMRQEGRLVTPNIINCEIKKEKISEAVRIVEKKGKLKPIAAYGFGNTADNIVKILKQYGRNKDNSAA